MKILYYKILFVFICLCVIIYFYGPKLGWFLTPSYTTLRITKAPEVNIETDIPNYPLEFISDGYKFVRITETKNVDWIWNYTVLNKSEKKCKITITFMLKDEDGKIINSYFGYGEAAAGSTITIKGEGSIPISDLGRVSGRTWKIVYEKSYSSGFIPEGF
jgi:hypothetical protein